MTLKIDMAKRTIIINKEQSLTDVISCTADTTLTIQCAENSKSNLLIEHHAGDIDCVLQLDRDSDITITFVGRSVATSSVTCHVLMNGAGASALVNGVYDIQASVLSFKTEQRHNAPHTTSKLYMRKIVRDASTAQYNGLIYLAGTAQHADAAQKDMTLLMGDTARAESVPAIEVCADEVKCAHGSAIGQLDAHQMHYMQSRGLSVQKAQSLLVHGFFATVLDTLQKELRVRAFACLGIQHEE